MDNAAADPQPGKQRAQQGREDRRAQRLARYDAVVALHQEGHSQAAISRQAGLGRKTVRRYRRAGAFPERAAAPARPTMLAPYEAYLRTRWTEGCHNAHQLWREIRGQGYAGRREHCPGGPLVRRRHPTRSRRRQRGPQLTLEQRADRGPDQPPQGAQAPDVRPCEARPAGEARPLCCLTPAPRRSQSLFRIDEHKTISVTPSSRLRRTGRLGRRAATRASRAVLPSPSSASSCPTGPRDGRCPRRSSVGTAPGRADSRRGGAVARRALNSQGTRGPSTGPQRTGMAPACAKRGGGKYAETRSIGTRAAARRAARRLGIVRHALPLAVRLSPVNVHTPKQPEPAIDAVPPTVGTAAYRGVHSVGSRADDASVPLESPVHERPPAPPPFAAFDAVGLAASTGGRRPRAAPEGALPGGDVEIPDWQDGPELAVALGEAEGWQAFDREPGAVRASTPSST
jgi:hypothetical protein